MKIVEKNKFSAEIESESKTIKVMVELYCQERHQESTTPCAECSELIEYAVSRVQQCPLKEKRTTCGKCEIHCYKPAMKKRIKEVMRFSGPRMMKSHPLLTVKHIIKGLTKK